MKGMTQRILTRHQPHVLVFVGEHGKSLAMSAAAFVLAAQGKRLVSVPGADDLERALLRQGRKRWFLNAFWQSLGWRAYPELVLVEMRCLPSAEAMKAVKPTVIVTSNVDENRLAELSKAEVDVVYNADAMIWPEEGKKVVTTRMTYGIDQKSDYQAEFIELIAADDAKLTGTTDPRWRGMQAKIKHKGSVLPLRVGGGLGRVHVYAALAAVTVTDALGIHVLDALKTLREFAPLPGRMTLIPGIKKSLIIDDSYQIDLTSAMQTFQEAALIPLVKGKRRFAVVGEMAEAGSDSAEQHALLGKALVELGYDFVIGIGERTTDLLRAAELSGMARGQLFHYMDVGEAGKFIQRELKRGELIIVKGGSKLKLEQIVKELMAFPLRAKSDLVQR